ncbi:MAG: endonuclease/exonuclease/phosphatase family protein [Bacteroidales bacterium]|nr:endonuclease/exonuclease/phosphatase family protein [Bacteroidales bacterium]
MIEHNLDIIKTADYIIDLGPEGGDGGGELVYAGTPEGCAACEESFTGRYLKQVLEAARLQEAYWANKPADFPTLDVLSKNLKAKSVQKVRLNNFNYGTGGLAVVTRYKVINQYSHPFDSTANGFMYVDILMNEDTVRLYNCHLQSIMISNSDVDMSNGFNRENKDKAMNLYSKFSEASAHRAVQVDTLVATLDTCPYPVLLCGDFNDVPLSYACFQVLASGERLHDTFMERGEGSGRTFSVMGVDFRIDYIMHSNLFKCLRHKVLEFNIANDHYPVVAEFMW